MQQRNNDGLYGRSDGQRDSEAPRVMADGFMR